MPATEPGGGTPFENMSHEQMLAWLDQANAGTVQAAADRLVAAAKEIRRIAEELKVRPQWVEWKGEGADAFRTWSADLANSTLRLGDFSEGAAKWLGEASGAIAQAQAAIPRDTKSAQANLAAAKASHNDPDAATVSAKSTSELAALEANREKVRLEAAAQMRKLGQTYQLSATQLDGLERPDFRPPPAAFLPPRDQEDEDLARPGTGSTSGTPGSGFASGTTRAEHGLATEQHAVAATSARHVVETSVSRTQPDHAIPPTVDSATHVGIDSVGSLPDVRHMPTGPTTVAPAPAPVDSPASPQAGGMMPPMSGGTGRLPSAPGQLGRPIGGGRLPNQPGQGPLGSAPGRGVTGAGPATGRSLPGSGAAAGGTQPGRAPTTGRGVPARPGITGGRPTAPVGGRATGRPPGGTVVGGEPAGGRGAIGRGTAPAQPGRPVTRQAEPTAGRSLSTPRDGIVGGRPQQTGRVPAPPGAPVASAPMRGGVTGGMPSEARTRGGTRDAAAGPARSARQQQPKRQTNGRSEPPSSG